MKIKKLLVLILSIITIIMCVYMTACSNRYYALKELGDRFEVVEEITANSYIVYDKQTKVEYFFICTNGGGLTVLLDENGKPLLYNGD